jgi:hypothetical protein
VATARPRCTIHAPGLDAVDGHFWQFQLFNVLGMALVVVSLVPLVNGKEERWPKRISSSVWPQKLLSFIWCQGLIYAYHCGVRAGWGAEAAMMTL